MKKMLQLIVVKDTTANGLEYSAYISRRRQDLVNLAREVQEEFCNVYEINATTEYEGYGETATFRAISDRGDTDGLVAESDCGDRLFITIAPVNIIEEDEE